MDYNIRINPLSPLVLVKFCSLFQFPLVMIFQFALMDSSNFDKMGYFYMYF